MKCPNCNAKLQNVAIHKLKCPNCEYEYDVVEIDYTENTNSYCRLCGEVLADDEISICKQCFDKIKDNKKEWSVIHEQKRFIRGSNEKQL